MTNDEPAWRIAHIEETGDRIVPGLNGEGELFDAMALLEYAMALRMYGECAPGGNETWKAWEASTLKFLHGDLND